MRKWLNEIHFYKFNKFHLFHLKEKFVLKQEKLRTLFLMLLGNIS